MLASPPATSPAPLPEPSAAPFSRAVPGARAHALCVHGYTGSPFEVLLVADALARIGVSSHAPLLPGHGTDPSALSALSWRDWARGADEAFAQMPPLPRVLVGSSMGALLMLRLAARFPDDITALVLMAPALRFHADGALAGALSRRGLWRAHPLMKKDPVGGDISDVEGRAKNCGYPLLATRGIGELLRLQEEVRPLLPRVKAPVCLFHGAQDHTIAPRASEEVEQGVSSAWTERHLLRDTFHVVGLDVDRDWVAQRAAHFVDRVLAQRVAGAQS